MSTAGRPAGAEQAWTVGSLLDWTERYLAQKGSDFPRTPKSLAPLAD